MSAVSAPLLHGAVNVPARVLYVAAQLAPFVLTHAAAIGLAGAARIALRLRPGSLAPRLGPWTLGLGKWPKPHFLLERACGCRVHRNSGNQTAANSKYGLHAALLGWTRAANSETARAIASIVDATDHPVKCTIAPWPDAGKGG
jgi:hypothetical protein